MNQLKIKHSITFILATYGLITIINTSQSEIRFYGKFNCSRYKPIQPYDISEFVGLWNYVRLFTQESIRVQPNCLKIKNTINKSTVIMNITIPHPDLEKNNILSSLVFGALDSKNEGKAQWIFLSDSPVAPSKWIILAQEKLHALYLICGDFPDGTSAVGEIGILSRETELSDEITAGYQEILYAYDLNVTLDIIQHQHCPPLLLN